MPRATDRLRHGIVGADDLVTKAASTGNLRSIPCHHAIGYYTALARMIAALIMPGAFWRQPRAIFGATVVLAK